MILQRAWRPWQRWNTGQHKARQTQAQISGQNAKMRSASAVANYVWLTDGFLLCCKKLGWVPGGPITADADRPMRP